MPPGAVAYSYKGYLPGVYPENMLGGNYARHASESNILCRERLKPLRRDYQPGPPKDDLLLAATKGALKKQPFMLGLQLLHPI